MPEQKITNVLEWRAGSVAAAVQANEKVGKSVSDVVVKTNLATTAQARNTETAKAGAVAFANEAEAARALGLSLEQLGVKADAAQNADVTTTTKQLDTEKQITAEMQKQIDINDKAARGSSPFGIGGADGKLTTGFGTLRAAGSAFANLGGGQGVTQAASLLGLGVELGALGVLAGGAAIALKVLNDENERATKVYAARLDVERSTAREVANLTAEAVQERIRAARQQLEVDREVARQQAAAGVLNAINVAIDPFRSARALAGLDSLTNAYNDALAKNTVAIQGDQAALEVYTRSLADGTTATADAQAAADKLADSQVEAANAAIKADGMTRDEREKRIGQINRELSLLSEQIASNEINSQAQRELGQQSAALYEEYRSLVSVTVSYADQLEREEALKQQLTERNDNYLEVLDAESDARTKQADLLLKLSDAEADAVHKSLHLAQETDAKTANALADASEKRLDLEEDEAEKRLDLAEDSAAKLAKLQRDAGRDLNTAVAERDALSAYKRQIKFNDDLQDQQDADVKQQERLDEQLAKQEEVVDKSLAKQLRTIDDQYNNQQDAIDDAFNKTLREVQRSYAEQQLIIDTSLSSIEFLTANGMANVVNVQAQGWINAQVAAQVGINAVVNTIAAGLGAFGGFLGVGNNARFPTPSTLSSTYPSQQFNRQFDQRYNTYLRAGQREITQF